LTPTKKKKTPQKQKTKSILATSSSKPEIHPEGFVLKIDVSKLLRNFPGVIYGNWDIQKT